MKEIQGIFTEEYNSSDSICDSEDNMAAAQYNSRHLTPQSPSKPDELHFIADTVEFNHLSRIGMNIEWLKKRLEHHKERLKYYLEDEQAWQAVEKFIELCSQQCKTVEKDWRNIYETLLLCDVCGNPEHLGRTEICCFHEEVLFCFTHRRRELEKEFKAKNLHNCDRMSFRSFFPLYLSSLANILKPIRGEFSELEKFFLEWERCESLFHTVWFYARNDHFVPYRSYSCLFERNYKKHEYLLRPLLESAPRDDDEEWMQIDDDNDKIHRKIPVVDDSSGEQRRQTRDQHDAVDDEFECQDSSSQKRRDRQVALQSDSASLASVHRQGTDARHVDGHGASSGRPVAHRSSTFHFGSNHSSILEDSHDSQRPSTTDLLSAKPSSAVDPRDSHPRSDPHYSTTERRNTSSSHGHHSNPCHDAPLDGRCSSAPKDRPLHDTERRWKEDFEKLLKKNMKLQKALSLSEEKCQNAVYNMQHLHEQYQQEIGARDAQMARLREQLRELEKSKKSIVNRYNTTNITFISFKMILYVFSVCRGRCPRACHMTRATWKTLA